MTSSDPPSADVLAAFGIAGIPQCMSGGQQLSWLVDTTILKPCEPDAVELIQWQSSIQAELFDIDHGSTDPKFRIAQPLQYQRNDTHPPCYVYKGWTATRFIEGTEDPDLEIRLDEILSASRSMHAMLRQIVSEPHSSILQRTDRWAYAERIAWDELTFAETPNTSSAMFDHLRIYIEKLEHLKRPFTTNKSTCQLIHGDLSGNILFAPRDCQHDYAPGIIDFTPQWRPVEFAEAIVVADALTWQRCGMGFVQRVGLTEVRFQMLIRALLFRIITYTIDVDEEFVRRNLGSMNIAHAMDVVDDCREHLTKQTEL